jgi:hypothetical protein
MSSKTSSPETGARKISMTRCKRCVVGAELGAAESEGAKVLPGGGTDGDGGTAGAVGSVGPGGLKVGATVLMPAGMSGQSQSSRTRGNTIAAMAQAPTNKRPRTRHLCLP